MSINEQIALAQGWTEIQFDYVGDDFELIGIPQGYTFPVIIPDWQDDADAALPLLAELMDGYLAFEAAQWVVGWWNHDGFRSIEDESAARAVCRAWLIWKGIEVEASE